MWIHFCSHTVKQAHGLQSRRANDIVIYVEQTAERCICTFVPCNYYKINNCSLYFILVMEKQKCLSTGWFKFMPNDISIFIRDGKVGHKNCYSSYPIPAVQLVLLNRKLSVTLLGKLDVFASHTHTHIYPSAVQYIYSTWEFELLTVIAPHETQT